MRCGHAARIYTHSYNQTPVTNCCQTIVTRSSTLQASSCSLSMIDFSPFIYVRLCVQCSIHSCTPLSPPSHIESGNEDIYLQLPSTYTAQSSRSTLLTINYAFVQILKISPSTQEQSVSYHLELNLQTPISSHLSFRSCSLHRKNLHMQKIHITLLSRCSCLSTQKLKLWTIQLLFCPLDSCRVVSSLRG